MKIDELPTLEGERVRLRHLVPGDWPGILEIFGDSRVMRFLGIPFMEVDVLSTEAEARTFIDEILQGMRRGEVWQWGLALTTTDELVGSCILNRFSWSNERAEVGFALAPSHWGTGLMTDGLDLLLGHCFGPLALFRLEADVDPRNEGALKLLRRQGFVPEGTLRARHLIDGERQDTCFLGLLAPDWRARRRDPSR